MDNRLFYEPCVEASTSKKSRANSVTESVGKPMHALKFIIKMCCLKEIYVFIFICPNKVVMETSLSNYNTALWKHVVPEGTVLTWLRASVANRLATSGKQWAQIFAKYNSGT